MSWSPVERAARIVYRMAGGDLDISTMIGQELDWHALVAVAVRENAVMELRRQTRRLPAGSVPADIEQQLARLASVSEFKLLLLEQRLVESLRALRGVGIDAVLLKGAALAKTVYGSFAERPMGDVDLLVRAERGEQAHALMVTNGWSWDRGAYPEARYRGHHHLPPLADTRGSGLRLEVHVAPLPGEHPFALSADTLRDSASLVEVGGTPVMIPEPNVHLLHIALHLVWSHAMDGAGWSSLRDIASMVRVGLVRWPAFVALAIETRGATCAYWALRLSHSLAGVPIPRDVLDVLRPRLPSRVLTLLERHFTSILLQAGSACPSVALSRGMWTLAIRPGQSGHGALRPWSAHNPALVGAPLSRPVEFSIRPLTRQLGRHAHWSRYFARLLRPQSGGAWRAEARTPGG